MPFSLLLLAALSSLLPSSCVSSLDDQGRTLLAWKESLSGAAALATWSPAAPSPCQWVGVFCDTGNRVVEIRLISVDLQGPLPSNFQALSSLRALTISFTNISGEIPVEFGDYAGLELVDLSNNHLSGEIPPEICKLSKLQTLRPERHIAGRDREL
ncbi:unnamed protein product [Spirodela intermedia]|uniref:Leucine-rich repeat-containing N-terminal plant-type domain-containing protein n=1 Tax=Spirodela intermedia TaxID=51605 RepID=A0A7I8JLN2_SPIIN|nr:unnamed protein product [Spirodela intermedia]CAA6670725.1 unnamed protein product [Spirodela intermedia]